MAAVITIATTGFVRPEDPCFDDGCSGEFDRLEGATDRTPRPTLCSASCSASVELRHSLAGLLRERRLSVAAVAIGSCSDCAQRCASLSMRL